MGYQDLLIFNLDIIIKLFAQNNYFWSIIKRFNNLMKTAIDGPNCTNPNNCSGNCCSIKIDVPKVLAEEYIRKKYAHKEDFNRSNIFSFQLRFDEISGKCFLFDSKINGCKVHNSGIKPPQCWIYPTNFSNPSNNNISCKKLSGWKITDFKKVEEAEKLLENYIFLCKLEEKKERSQICKRLGKLSLKEMDANAGKLIHKIRESPPSKLGGFIDVWDQFNILSAEGLSLQMKKFCLNYNKNCNFLPDNFLECKNICDKVAHQLILFLNRIILKYINKYGLDIRGEYPLIKLFNYL